MPEPSHPARWRSGFRRVPPAAGIVVLTGAMLVAGCAGLRDGREATVFAGDAAARDARRAGELSVAACRAAYEATDSAVVAAGVEDAGDTRIAGFPYLRVDRLGVALKPGAGSARAGDHRFHAWLARLRALAAAARANELANLPAARRPAGAWEERLVACAGLLQATDLATPVQREALRGAATVPPDYVTAYRALGLYPLTSIPFAHGIRALHRDLDAAFAPAVDALPVAGDLVRYVPRDAPRLAPAAVARIIVRSRDPALGIVVPAAADRAALFAAFAPVVEVDVASEDDLLGAPAWGEGPAPYVDVRRPTVYQHLSHVRLDDRWLVTFTYVIWFPARTPDGAWDILAGRFDGVMLRVTVDHDGRALLYDVVHACGCYHAFFPALGLERRPVAPDDGEPLFVPQRILPGGEPMILRLAARTHHVQRLYRSRQSPGRPYVLADYDVLRSLPLPGGARRSLFDAQGFVPGTERPERWLFWPMGVANPGAMRQIGRHAVAFVGTRHFDDPDLIERYFRRRPRPAR